MAATEAAVLAAVASVLIALMLCGLVWKLVKIAHKSGRSLRMKVSGKSLAIEVDFPSKGDLK